MIVVDRVDGRVRVAITDGDLLAVTYMDPSTSIEIADQLRAAGEEILSDRAALERWSGEVRS